MSVQIFRDVEEALSREVRRITFNNQRTPSRIVLQDAFDPFTGEVIQVPVEPSFYDSSADANNVQYPQFFIKLLKSREDRFTGRVVPQDEKWIQSYITSSPQIFQTIVSSVEGSIVAPGNSLTTTLFQIRKVQPGQMLRLLNGNNKGTYFIDTIVINNSGPHTITLKQDLLLNLPTLLFDIDTRVAVFTAPVDLNTIKISDVFTDSLNNTFNVVAIDTAHNKITLDGITSPSLSLGAKITRVGNVLTAADPSVVSMVIMDPTKPVKAVGLQGATAVTSNVTMLPPQIPIDAYYLVRIDSKERASHIDVLNRIWEEFNPPRTGLVTLIRSNLSVETNLKVDVTSGGSTTINVGDNSQYNLGETVFIIDDFKPTKTDDGKLEIPFSSKIIAKSSTDSLVLQNTVPDTYTVANNTKIVSNAEYYNHMFHFVSHITKDVEGSQYWVHEFIFWVQVWVDRLGKPENTGVVQDVGIKYENMSGTVLISD